MNPQFRLSVLAAMLASVPEWNEDVAQAYRLKGGSTFTPSSFEHLPPAMQIQYAEFLDAINGDEETHTKWGHLLEDAAELDYEKLSQDEQEDKSTADAQAVLKEPAAPDTQEDQVSTGDVQKSEDGGKQEGQGGAARGQPQDQQQDQSQGGDGQKQETDAAATDAKTEPKAKKSGKGGK